MKVGKLYQNIGGWKTMKVPWKTVDRGWTNGPIVYSNKDEIFLYLGERCLPGVGSAYFTFLDRTGQIIVLIPSPTVDELKLARNKQ